jgi:type VI secretion system protein ImpA
VYPRRDPPQEGGDYEARVAVFEWLDGVMAHTLRVFVGLLPLAQRKQQQVTLADWERLIAAELSGASQGPEGHEAADGDVPPLARDDILSNVAQHQPEVVARRCEQVDAARASLLGLTAALDAHLGADAPALRKLAAVLDSLERVLTQVRAALPVRAPGGGGAGEARSEVTQDLPGDAHAADDADIGMLPLAPQGPVVVGAWQHRDEAYRTLEALAEYLATVEPHSPTPYLIRRAVNWGRLPLPELMAEIMREEGDLNRMVQLLGLSR